MVEIDRPPPMTATDLEASIAKWEEQQKRLLDEGWPPALVKASMDSFDYAIGLRNGLCVRFESATDLSHGWVRLDGVRSVSQDPYCDDDVPHSGIFERGFEVFLGDIVWAADAPHGS